LALAPTEPNETFIREVDEELRRSQAENFFKRWGLWIIAAAVLFLIAVAALLFWRNQQAQRAQGHSEQLAAILTDISQQRTKDVPQRLGVLAAEGNDSFKATALMTRAAVAVQNGDRPAAITDYRAVLDDQGVPQAYRDAAAVRLTQLEFDGMKPEDVIARLQGLATPESAWYGTAGELTGMAMLKQNRRTEAARLFAAIGADQNVPETIRRRATQVAGSLGVDATAAR
jgi:hypothetical protein